MMSGLLSVFEGAPEPEEQPTLPSVALSADDLHHLLRVKRRREAVRYVDDVGESSISDIADYVTAKETGKELNEITSADRQKVYVGLYQVHIPNLAEHGLLDEERGAVTPTDQTAAVADIVRCIDDATEEGSA